MRLKWTIEYSVKVKEIDEQHKKLFGFINELDDVIKAGVERAEIARIVEKMNQYAQYHFATEEGYFEKFGYPETKKQKEKHSRYESKIILFDQQMKDNKIPDDRLLDFAYEILDFLEDWWVDHILHEDMGYSNFFNDHGLS